MKRIVEGNTLIFRDEREKEILRMEEERQEEGIWLIRLQGALRSECAHDVADELWALISVGEGIALDLGELELLSGTFNSILVDLTSRMEQTDFETMPIRNLPRNLFEDLKKEGYIRLLDYELKED